MADVLMTFDGITKPVPEDMVARVLAAGGVRAAPSPPGGLRPTGSTDSIGGASMDAPAPAARRGRGSGGGIDAGPPPAGETEAAPATTLMEFQGITKPVPADMVERVKAAGGVVVEGPGFFQRAANLVTGNDRKVESTEALPDIALMPEMRAASISANLPALGGVVAPALVSVEGALRQIAKVAKEGKDPEQAIKDFAADYKGQLLTMVGAALATPEEKVKILKANNPDIEIRQDERGNFIAKSANGDEFAIKPGLRPSDAPQVAQGAATFTPAGKVEQFALAGVGKLGARASRLLAGGATQAAIEGSQALTGGEFDAEQIPLAAGANVIAGEIPGALKAAGKALNGGDIQAAKNAAARAAQAEKLAAGAGKENFAFRKIYQDIVDRYDSADLDGQHFFDRLPKFKEELQKARDYLKKAAEREAKAVGTPPVGDEGTEVLQRAIGDAADTVDSTMTDTVNARGGSGAGSTAVARRGPIASADALENSGTSTPMPATNPGRARPRQPAAAPPAEPTGTRTAPVPQEPTETATAPIRRLPPPTEGLEPTEVLPREVPIDPTAPVRKRNLSDEEAIALIRSTALELGTLDGATLASKARLSSAQTTRALEYLVKNYKFRAQVAANAPKVEAAAAPAVSLSEAAAPPQSVADLPLAPRAAPAPPSIPDPSLMEGIAGREVGGRVTPTTVKQTGAVMNTSTLREKYEGLRTPAERMKFIAEQLEQGFHPERLRTRLGITIRQWKRESMSRAAAIAERKAGAASVPAPRPPPAAPPKAPPAAPPAPLAEAAAPPAVQPAPPGGLAEAGAPKAAKPAVSQDLRALGESIKVARRSALKQMRDLTPQRAFSIGEDAIHTSGGDPNADFAGLADKAKAQSNMGAALLDEINGTLGLKGSKRVRTPQEAWAAIMRKNPPTTGETVAETIRNKIEALDSAARLMRTIPGWEKFSIEGELAALEAAAKDLSHLENTGIRSLGPLPF